MAVTIVDVAKRAGVSISTVSKYINGGNVIEPKRSEIIKAIDELGFVVNPFARGMKTQKTNTIGVLIPGMTEYFGTVLLSHLNKYFYSKNYTVVTCDYKFDENGTNAREKIDFLMRKNRARYVKMQTAVPDAHAVPQDPRADAAKPSRSDRRQAADAIRGCGRRRASPPIRTAAHGRGPGTSRARTRRRIRHAPSSDRAGSSSTGTAPSRNTAPPGRPRHRTGSGTARPAISEAEPTSRASARP